MVENSLKLGRTGENIALDFLKKAGYKIIQNNFRTKLGELDIIAKDKNTICFIEVKCRSYNSWGLPEEAVNNSKRSKISKSALLFLKKNNLLDKKARFDVVSINLDTTKARLFKNAFELDKRYSY